MIIFKYSFIILLLMPRRRDKCDRCGSTKSKQYWDFEDDTSLCDKCYKKFADEWQREINVQKFKSKASSILKVSAIIIFSMAFIYLLYFFFSGGYGFNGYNSDGYDRQGYNMYGYDRNGFDIDGFDENGFDKRGYDSQGYNKQGYDAAGFNKYGYDRLGYDKDGFNRQGYDKKGYDSNGYDINGLDRDGWSRNPDNIEIVEHVVADYHEDHTYILEDFFVCSDMAIDVWNLVKTKGVNAQICAGNIDEDIFRKTDWDYVLGNMNHAWVLAETSPFSWLALETTGGYVVWGEGNGDYGDVENDLYYSSKICFPNPKDFKEFITLRDRYFDVCTEANYLTDWWNDEVAGNVYSNMDEVNQELGRINALVEECDSIVTDLSHLMS
jgi:hypothetical protein